MLATFIIGLREGLEAALIVGIIAAFLRNRGERLAALWIGVGLAVALSLAVGIGLGLVEQALPQAEQEALETVIGAIAIVFVTGMISWMNAHARDMRRTLEAEAATALSRNGARALAGMAFLAVLKEGFETAVFLLATFSAAQSTGLAATGALLGILLAMAIGWGIYAGGVRLNLGRFFRLTGGFLVLVAAGLVLTALRTAHEAGWIDAGQQATLDLSWLVAPGTIRSALITGMLGIPADPRVIEVLGWLAYLVPTALCLFWPARHRPSPRAAMRLRVGGGLALLLLAAGLALFYPRPRLDPERAVPVVSGASVLGNARLLPAALRLSLDGAAPEIIPLDPAAARADTSSGIPARLWRIEQDRPTPSAPSSLDLDAVIALSGGRLPVGMNARRHPGPFAATWRTHRVLDVWTADGALLDLAGQTATTVTLSGGGLASPRSLAAPAQAGAWRLASDAADTLAAAQAERALWAVQVPLALLLAALVLGGLALRRRLRPLSPSPACTGNPAARPRPGDAHAAD